jgi:hypothetical protein
MDWLYPIRTGKTFFDVWSVCHFAFWLVFAFNWVALTVRHQLQVAWWAVYVVALVFALVWELIEWRILEPNGYVLHPEIWFNRWLSDPSIALVAVVVGLWLVRHQ